LKAVSNSGKGKYLKPVVNDDAIWRNRFRSDSGILEAVPAQDENGFGSHVEKVPEIYLFRFSEQ
jgi:hypothetical protein